MMMAFLRVAHADRVGDLTAMLSSSSEKTRISAVVSLAKLGDKRALKPLVTALHDLNAQIRARKFFRVVFLMPLMLSPVAVSWMVGKSLMEYRFGPAATLARHLGWENPAFFSDPIIARISIMVLDAWTFIPFMMIMLLAGLQAMSREILEAARVDGANAWQTFWQVTFPLMLPVSVTAVILRIIFKLKLADIIITVTSGGPGGATDSVSSFIYREYRDRSNVGYGTMLAMFYLVAIIVFVTVLLNIANRFMQRSS